MLDKVNFHVWFNDYIVLWGGKLAAALLIFAAGYVAVKWLTAVSRKLMARAGLDMMLTRFASSLLRGLMLLVVTVAALDQLGVDTTSFVALIGAAGLAVGLAMQGSLANFAAGIMLIFFKPFKVGDFVEAGGVAGTVIEIRIFNTIFTTPDNKQIIVPNGQIYGGIITNYSAHETRRIDLLFSIGYGDDIKLAKVAIERVLKEDQRVLSEPAWVVGVAELADSAVNLYVRPWVKSTDYWAVRTDLLERVKAVFDAEQISIPYPQADVHLHQVA